MGVRVVVQEEVWESRLLWFVVGRVVAVVALAGVAVVVAAGTTLNYCNTKNDTLFSFINTLIF